MASHKLFLVLTCLLMSAAISCDLLSGEKDMPIPLDETMENTGAFLRIIDVETAYFDILNIEEAAFVFTAEYWDNEGQSLLENVQFFANYTGAGFEGDAPEIGRTLFKSVDASEFGTNDATGWPSKRFVLTVSDINAALGISSDDNLLEDRYQIDWVLNLSDGRSITADDMSPAITDGFFSSPNRANISVVAKIPEDQFVGSYEFTQLNPGTFGAVFYTMTFEADLRVNPANDINGRLFNAQYSGGWMSNWGPWPLLFRVEHDTDNNSVTFSTTVYAGLGCSALGLHLGPEREHNSHFERSDDSEFTLGITENTEGDCGAPPVQVIFDVVKL